MHVIKRLLRTRSDLDAIRRSGRFAADWYRATYLGGLPGEDPLRHYVTRGAALGHWPHPLFDPQSYLARYDDVRAAGLDPFVHYVTLGVVEGRDPNPWFDRSWYGRHGGDAAFDPLSGIEAAHGFLSPRFAALGAARPLQALSDFLHGGRYEDPVGVVELRTPDFVSGWIASGSETAYPEIVVVGRRVGAAAHFNPRPDVAARIGRPAHGFLFTFDTPLAGAEEVVVRFPCGAELHGAPYRQGDAEPTSEAVGDVQVHFDTPEGAITRRLAEVAGWVRLASSDASFEIRTNGRRHHAFYALRTDVIERFDDPLCFGFSFPFDVAAALEEGRAGLEIEVVVSGRCVERRVVPFDLPPLPRERPVLNVFMHIPKTAGISLANAINGLPDARALWLYDKGPMAISDQLALLSPGAFDDLRFVGGHFLHGIHERIGRRCSYVAFLREPVSYIKSFYLYMKYVARAPAYAGATLDDLVGHRHEFDNAFTRWFAAVPSGRPVEEADLATALATMERDFAFVGMVERMDESVARLSELWGVDLPVLRENRTPPVAEAATIDLRDLARRTAPNVRFDRVLVARAEALFWT